jgi:hypothetical protein
MGKRRSLSVRRGRRDRDEELRAAHRRMFDEIEQSRTTPKREEQVSEALQRLIDACEAYCFARHVPEASRPQAS